MIGLYNLDIYMTVQSFYILLNSWYQWFPVVLRMEFHTWNTEKALSLLLLACTKWLLHFTKEVMLWVPECLLQNTQYCADSCRITTSIISSFLSPSASHGGWVTRSPLCYISVPLVPLHCSPHLRLPQPLVQSHSWFAFSTAVARWSVYSEVPGLL